MEKKEEEAVESNLPKSPPVTVRPAGENSDSIKVVKKFPIPLRSGWYDIIDGNLKQQGQLFLKVVYRPTSARVWPAVGGGDAHGVHPERYYECHDCYFPLRSGNRVSAARISRYYHLQDVQKMFAPF